MNVKELLSTMARYNQWAHKRLLELINVQSSDLHHAPVPSSFDSLYKTLFHVWGAESLWLGRLNLAPIKISGDPFNGSMEKISRAIESVDQQWVDWFASKEDDQLKEKVQYRNLAGLEFEQSYDLLLPHIFNHSTYHNGQIVTILRALGVQEIPSTDFSTWVNQPTPH